MSKRCFVIQGFGKKQDYQQGKLFDLATSYAVIKEATEDAARNVTELTTSARMPLLVRSCTISC